MSTESARKAAEELWNLKYGLKDDWIEKATPIISAACQTVAPPPDNIRDAHLFLSHYVAHVGHDADCGCNICRAFRLLDSSGAAPAVSTPRTDVSAMARAISDKQHDLGRFLDLGELVLLLEGR